MNTYGELYNASKKRLAGQMQVLNLSLSWKDGVGFLFCFAGTCRRPKSIGLSDTGDQQLIL